MTWQIPLSDVAMADEDVSSVLACLRSGWLTMGPLTAKFEEEFAAHVGARHAVAVSSGTAALHLALLAAGIGPGDEVIVPGFTFVASAAAVRHCGAEPVLCDIGSLREPNLDDAAVRAVLGPRTRAIIAVHFMGYPAPLAPLQALCAEHGLALIEDASQAVDAELDDGRRAGTAGALGCFSFFSKKQLCTGEGGMVVCEDAALAARVRSLRSHAMTTMSWDRHRGHAESYDVVDIGYNFRMDEPHAALGRSRLQRLRADIEARRLAARRYASRLEASAPKVELLWPGEDWLARSSHFAFPVLLRSAEDRDRFRERLAAEGIQTTFYPALSQLSAYAEASLPLAEDIGLRHCALPLYAGLSEHDQDRVCSTIEAVL